jgi:hypothetical protein
MDRTFNVGDTVDIAINDSGPRPRTLGEVRGIVLRGNSEYDVMIHPGEDREDVAELLARVDVTLEDMREGAVHVLCNCQPEELTLVRSWGDN